MNLSCKSKTLGSVIMGNGGEFLLPWMLYSVYVHDNLIEMINSILC